MARWILKILGKSGRARIALVIGVLTVIFVLNFTFSALHKMSSYEVAAYAATESTKLIRAGQTISAISRGGGVVTVTLSSNYPNNNLKPSQSIVIDTGTGGTASFNGTFTIAGVTSQTSFTYAQSGTDETGTIGTSPYAGGDYTTLTTWEAAVAADLTAGGGTIA
ncbi:MAG: hypothetical protein ISS34_07430, partial [Candidatus Omnitrophica bacterium]|nr:hypothetical protein [Candidatus Omnitrophota bacterium]